MLSTNNKNGSIAIMILLITFFLAILIIGWLNYASLQRKVITNQQQKEQSLQISESGVQYALFLLNNEVCTRDKLIHNSPLVRTVTDIDNTEEIGRYKLEISGADEDRIKIISRGYSKNTPQNCQTVTSYIRPTWSTTGVTKYYVYQQNFHNKNNCPTELPAITNLSCKS